MSEKVEVRRDTGGVAFRLLLSEEVAGGRAVDYIRLQRGDIAPENAKVFRYKCLHVPTGETDICVIAIFGELNLAQDGMNLLLKKWSNDLPDVWRYEIE